MNSRFSTLAALGQSMPLVFDLSIRTPKNLVVQRLDGAQDAIGEPAINEFAFDEICFDERAVFEFALFEDPGRHVLFGGGEIGETCLEIAGFGKDHEAILCHTACVGQLNMEALLRFLTGGRGRRYYPFKKGIIGD